MERWDRASWEEEWAWFLLRKTSSWCGTTRPEPSEEPALQEPAGLCVWSRKSGGMGSQRVPHGGQGRLVVTQEGVLEGDPATVTDGRQHRLWVQVGVGVALWSGVTGGGPG